MHIRFRRWADAALWAALVLLPVWFWLRLFTTDGFLAHSDLYEQFLPVFLSPRAWWSSAEFAGLPVFADPQNTTWYPLHLLFARALGSWSGYIVAPYVVAALGAGAYAWQITRSRAAALVAGLAWPWSEALADLFPHLAMLHGFAWLPWILFGLEKIVETRRPRWIVATAFAFACLALSGHPQVSVYCGYLSGLYAVALWAAESRRLHVIAAIGAAFVLGAALAAVQIVPTMEVSEWIARDRVSFSQFAGSFAKEPHELLTVLVPQFCHERREAPSYVGLLPVYAGLVSMAGAAYQWRTWLWAVVAVVCLLLGLGPATPLAEVAYDLPLYDKFRVVARHLALYSFAAIALGAIGVGALVHGRVRLKAAAVPVAVAAVATGVALRVVGARPDLFPPDCAGRSLQWLFEPRVAPLAAHALMASALALTVVLAAWPRARRVALVGLAIVPALDLLNAQSVEVDLYGAVPPTVMRRELIEPSVHAVALRDAVRPLGQRVLTVEGSATDPVIPGAFARLWGVHTLGGYNPLVPARLTTLGEIQANGAAPSRLLFSHDWVLDLLSVRAVVLRASVITSLAPLPAGISIDGLPPLDVEMGPADCRPRGPVVLTFGVTPPVEAAGVVFRSMLNCADNVDPGTVAGTLTLVTEDGRTETLPIQAGLPQPGRLRALNGDLPGGAEILPIENWSVMFPRPAEIREIRLETATLPAWVYVDRLALLDPEGRVRAVQMPAAALADRFRWREVSRFRTSRNSDRGRDEDVDGEEELVVFENLRAQPRAWFVGSAVEVPEEQMPDVVRFGMLRDGRRFDVSRQVLVPPDVDLRLGAATTAPSGRVTIHQIGDGHLAFGVDAAADGVLVISEMHHPGWRARVDGAPVELLRVNYATMGVRVPAGVHHVTLEFAPVSLRLGAGISATAMVMLTACLLWPLRRRWARRDS